MLEVLIAIGIWAIGLLILTLILKIIIPIETGDFTAEGSEGTAEFGHGRVHA